MSRPAILRRDRERGTILIAALLVMMMLSAALALTARTLIAGHRHRQRIRRRARICAVIDTAITRARAELAAGSDLAGEKTGRVDGVTFHIVSQVPTVPGRRQLTVRAELATGGTRIVRVVLMRTKAGVWKILDYRRVGEAAATVEEIGGEDMPR